MKLNFKWLVLIFLSIVISLGYLGGWWEEMIGEIFSKNAPPAGLSQSEPPALVIIRPRLTGWEDNKKSWEIEAEKIWKSNNNHQYHFKDIRNGVVFSVKDKRVDFVAGWARLKRNRSELYLGGGLEARIDDASLKTAEGMLNYKQEEMECPQEVVYQENNTIIKARKMIVRLKNDEIFLEGNVQLFEKKDQMKADGLLYNTKEKKYYLITPQEILLYP
jgi:lipopolysaccharide export system protein LptC